ncbi:unnamed protein product [Lampetra planeri]
MSRTAPLLRELWRAPSPPPSSIDGNWTLAGLFHKTVPDYLRKSGRGGGAPLRTETASGGARGRVPPLGARARLSSDSPHA